MAEAQRFELWEGFPSPVFKTEEKSFNISHINQFDRIKVVISSFTNQ